MLHSNTLVKCLNIWWRLYMRMVNLRPLDLLESLPELENWEIWQGSIREFVNKIVPKVSKILLTNAMWWLVIRAEGLKLIGRRHFSLLREGTVSSVRSLWLSRASSGVSDEVISLLDLVSKSSSNEWLTGVVLANSSKDVRLSANHHQAPLWTLCHFCLCTFQCYID